MRKLAPIPLAALLFAACSEGPVSPLADAAPQFKAFHTTIDAPGGVTATFAPGTVSGTKVTISWTWSDAEDSWDLVSFKVKRDGVVVAGEPANEKPYAAGVTLLRSHPDDNVPDGVYEYCVEVMAKYKFLEGPEETHHNRTCATVTVGSTDTYAFVRIAAPNNNTETAAPGPLAPSKTGDIHVWAVLYKNGLLVNDCATVPVANATATITFTSPGSGTQTVTAAECDFNGSANRWRYRFTFTQAFNNQVSSGTIDLKVNGTTVTTYNFTTN